MKRIFDIGFSIFAIILFFPLFVIIYLLIFLLERTNPIFIQERPGLNGEKFKVYKFKTMYDNSDEILEKFLESHPKAKEEWNKYKKLKTYDPRVTPIGKFLRKTSLDELPQFINVLKGDMSIVGPRPYILKEFEEHNITKEIMDKIFSVKPGITGLWQVSSRNEATFEERLQQDLEYIYKQSFWLDLKIILKTIKVMITGKGAY